MNDDSHKQLLDLIQTTFQGKLCMFIGVENATLNMLWENNLQVIVFYQDKVSICRDKRTLTRKKPGTMHFLQDSLRAQRSHIGAHYENTPIQSILKFSPPKTESFLIKILIIFIFLLET